MNLYLIAAFVIFVIYFFQDIVRKRNIRIIKSLSVSILPLWFFMTLLIYGYYFYARGFFSQYATELYPPLILCLGYIFSDKILQNSRNKFKLLFIIIVLSYAVFGVYSWISHQPDVSLYLILGVYVVILSFCFRELVYKQYKVRFIFLALLFLMIIAVSHTQYITNFIEGRVITITILTIVYLSLSVLMKKGLIRNQNCFTKYVTVPILISTLIISFGIAGKFLDLKYDSCWTPATVKAVEKHYLEKGASNATVLSGAMIWVVNPNVEPYLNITHPLAFMSELDNPYIQKVKDGLKETPSDYIVMDGYTKRAYHFIDKQLEALIRQRYSLVDEIDGSRFTVSLFKLKKR